MTTPDLETLVCQTRFSDDDLRRLLSLSDENDCNLLYRKAFEQTSKWHGNALFWRGLIEISNICTYDCRYCGLRKSNHRLHRYALSVDEIVDAATCALEAGYGSVVLQGGERTDPKFIGFVSEAVAAIHEKSRRMGFKRGCGITLSFGEQSIETYQRWKDAAGNPDAVRYLLRLETTNPILFRHIHGNGPRKKILAERFLALHDLRTAGYQVGTGVMIGIPGQTVDDLVKDIRTFERMDIDMIGMGPYLVSRQADMVAEGMMPEEPLLRLSRNMIAVTRLVLPKCNIAAATALETLHKSGRALGVLSGCNVMMPNIGPTRVRGDYSLYDRKAVTESEANANVALEKSILQLTGRTVAKNRLGSSLLFRERHRLLPD